MRVYVLFLTFLYCAAFGVLGALIASLGPILPEIAAQVGSGIRGTGPAWLARSAGYLIGSFSGPLYDQPWISPNVFTAAAVAVAGIGAALVPTAMAIPVLGLMLFAGGAGMGVLDSGVNVSLLWLYAGEEEQPSSGDGPPGGGSSEAPSTASSETGDASSQASDQASGPRSKQAHDQAGGLAESAMQALHFAFAFGAVLSPLGLQYATELHESSRSQSSNSTDAGAGSGGLSRNSITEGSSIGLPYYAPVFFAMGAAGILIAFGIGCTPSPPRPWERSSAKDSGGVADGAEAGREDTVGLAAAGEGLGEGVATSSIADPGARKEAAAAARSDDESLAAAAGQKASSSQGLGQEESLHADVEMVSLQPAPSPSTGPGTDQKKPGESSKSCACCFGGCGPADYRRWVLIVVLAVLLGLYVGCEAGYGGFVSTFARYKLGWSATKAQTLAAVFWAAVAVGRLVSVWVARCLSSEWMISLAVGGSAASSALLWLLLGQGVGGGIVTVSGSIADIILWVLTAAIGLSMANVFPTAISLAEGYTEVEGRHATLLVVGSATGEMLLPYLIAILTGNEIEAGESGPGAGQGLDGVDDAPILSDSGTSSTDGEPASIFAVVGLGCLGQLLMLTLAIWWGRRSVALAAASTASASNSS